MMNSLKTQRKKITQDEQNVGPYSICDDVLLYSDRLVVPEALQ